MTCDDGGCTADAVWLVDDGAETYHCAAHIQERLGRIRRGLIFTVKGIPAP